ncbi:phosphatase PAP2 family protein [Halalkalibacter kiskunsagensis]|uniref:Phosphatase PAP2 family protein n=1 Tax=Halalkalibacter kiskunsagensis TaxID=1548599 RepID=A0ABV6KEL7_9BACI
MNRQLLLKLILLGIIPLLGFIVVTYFVVTERVLPFDENIIKIVLTFEHPIVTKGMLMMSFIGNTWPVIIISFIFILIIYKVYRKRHEVTLFIFVLIGSTVLNQLLKYWLKRERPVFDPIVTESGFSYPSGHSMAALSLYGIITFLFWRHIPTSLGRKLLIAFTAFMILSIGFSRIYLRVHFPTDVIGAYLLSGFWLFITIWFYQYLQEKQYNEQK